MAGIRKGLVRVTRAEAIEYGESKKSRIQEKIRRVGSSNGDYAIYYSEMAFTSAAVAALREQEERRWIPVAERLPELGERVLCTDGVAVFEQYRVELSCVYGMWDRFGMKSPMQEVTHWMPIPEPKKEGANNGW